MFCNPPGINFNLVRTNKVKIIKNKLINKDQKKVLVTGKLPIKNKMSGASFTLNSIHLTKKYFCYFPPLPLLFRLLHFFSLILFGG